MAEHDSQKKEKDLENIKKVVEVRRQKKLDLVEEKDFRRVELPGKYTVKLLQRWEDGKFEEEYLKKLERNQQS